MQFGLDDNVLVMLSGYFTSMEQIAEVKIYGSRAKGTYKNGSDIDLAFWGNDLNERKIMADLDELPTAYSFDVCVFEQLKNEHLKDEIVKFGQTIYKK